MADKASKVCEPTLTSATPPSHKKTDAARDDGTHRGDAPDRVYLGLTQLKDTWNEFRKQQRERA